MKKYLAIVLIASACSTSENPKRIKANFQRHIEYLASDELKGRETGTEGEEMAAEYIANEFKIAGIEAKGSEGYYQEFEFLSGKTFAENHFMLNGEEIQKDQDYFVMNFSGNGEVKSELIIAGFGIQAEELGLDEYKRLRKAEGKVFLIDVSSPDGIHPHSKYKAYHDLRNRVRTAKENGAKAVIFYNPGELANDPRKNYARKMERLDIPVVFYSGEKEFKNGDSVSIKVEMEDEYRSGKNVIAYIDNNASATVVIGAHYDHLGMGDEGSLYRGDSEAIHNGADDNASGTAVLLELARTIQKSRKLNQNFLFIAFSGEEKGLLGSGHFTDEPTIDLEDVNYMINMDMVGRLDTTGTLTVFGIGTSPIWDSLVDLETIAGALNIMEKPDGVGPSDHTSFYLEDIPVLHLFTGAHSDYHKPSDDFDKINYDGMYKVYSYVMNVVSAVNDQKLEFTKTKEGDNQQAPRFSVTLGVVPDYTFSGKGMRIDGITDGRPADNAGLLKGDVVIRMGENEVTDMMAYMNALSMFKKGDTTRVSVKRGSEEVSVEVVF